MIVGSQGGIAKDIGHIRSTQHFQSSAHVQIVGRTAHRGKDIDEGFAIGYAVRILLGTDNLEVTGPHAHINHHTVEVGEIDRALNVQRILVIGIEGEVVEQQLGIDNTHRVVVETKGHTIGYTLHIRGIEVDFAINMGSRQRTVNGHLAIRIALQAEQMIGNETIDNVQGQVHQLQIGIERALAYIIIGTRQETYLHIVLHQTGFYSMGGIAFLQIEQFGADIADRTALVGHIANGHIAGYGDVPLGILHHVVVTLQHTGHAWHIGDDRGHLVQIEFVQADGNVLQSSWVAVRGINLHTHAVLSQQVYIGFHLLVVTQEQIVVGIQLEEFIAQGGRFGHETEMKSAIQHLSLSTNAGTHLIVGIIIANAKGGSTLLQHAIEEGIEHELRIAFVVAHLTSERKAFLTLCQAEVDGVQTYIVVGERMDIAIAVDTRSRRGVHIEQQLLEVDILALQDGYQRILALALHMYLQGGQQSAQSGLVDNILGILGTGTIAEHRDLLQQLFVIATAVHLHDEVATL